MVHTGQGVHTPGDTEVTQQGVGTQSSGGHGARAVAAPAGPSRAPASQQLQEPPGERAEPEGAQRKCQAPRDAPPPVGSAVLSSRPARPQPGAIRRVPGKASI